MGDVDDFLMNHSMGSRTDTDIVPQAISVLTFLDRVEKHVKAFRKQYDRLCEFAHPNWAGTALLYSKHDQEKLWTDFGANIRGIEGPKQVGVTNLSVALVLFERSYNGIAHLMPAFIKLCRSSAG